MKNNEERKANKTTCPKCGNDKHIYYSLESRYVCRQCWNTFSFKELQAHESNEEFQQIIKLVGELDYSKLKRVITAERREKADIDLIRKKAKKVIFDLYNRPLAASAEKEGYKAFRRDGRVGFKYEVDIAKHNNL